MPFVFIASNYMIRGSVIILVPASPMMRPAYPSSPRSAVVDTYHGVRVPDPYRWLEDAGSPETREWVAAQNALTRSVLDGPVRDELVTRLTTLYDYPRTGVPFKRGRHYFFTHNTGLQDQPVLYVQDGLDGAPRVLIDPNVMLAEGPIALTAMAPDETGRLLAYARSESGSDRQDLFIRDVDTGRDLPDHLQWVKFVSVAWLRSSEGFYYTRFPAPGSVAAGDENYFNRVCYHRLGDAQDQDALIFDSPAERETVFAVEVSDEDRWVVITAYRGSSDKSEVYLLDREAAGSRPVPLFTGYSAAYAFVESAGGRLFFHTDQGAPLGRIIAVDPPNLAGRGRRGRARKAGQALVLHHRERHAGRVVPAQRERPDPPVRFVRVTRPARLSCPRLDRSPASAGGRKTTRCSSGSPPSHTRRRAFGTSFDPHARTLPCWLGTATGSRAGLVGSEYRITQVWYPSKDGTSVSMFLVHRKPTSRTTATVRCC